jgi:benzoylformate decarboxylase
VPIIVLCTQQHSELLLLEPLLESDLVQIARRFTKWAHQVRFPAELPLVMQRAFKEAMTPPTQPVFVAISRRRRRGSHPQRLPRAGMTASHARHGSPSRPVAAAAQLRQFQPARPRGGRDLHQGRA